MNGMAGPSRLPYASINWIRFGGCLSPGAVSTATGPLVRWGKRSRNRLGGARSGRRDGFRGGRTPSTPKPARLPRAKADRTRRFGRARRLVRGAHSRPVHGVLKARKHDKPLMHQGIGRCINHICTLNVAFERTSSGAYMSLGVANRGCGHRLPSEHFTEERDPKCSNFNQRLRGSLLGRLSSRPSQASFSHSWNTEHMACNWT